jgi:hypothetical protein
MQNDQFEKPVASAPLAAGLVDDDVERLRLRRQHYHVPTAAQKAKAAEDRRFWNSKANAPEIAAYKQRLATLHENNERLTTAGLAVVKFVAADDPRDVDCRALVAQISLLDRLIREQVEALERSQSAAAAAERQRNIAKETPTERAIRVLFELREADAARIANLEAELYARTRYEERPAPARPKAPMSHMAVAVGNGLCPEVSLPSSSGAPSNNPSGARRLSSR